ncbi:MAG: metallophosphoesterase [Archangiaceae bacterium]|nr:metallophosphoesterase [Archangiaceae bacterium]
MRLVHLSDLHHQLDWRQRSWWSSGWRGAPGRFELHGLKRLERFAQARERITRLVDAALEAEPDQVLLTGDLTALGDPTELGEVRALLAPLIDSGKLLVIPGNHDRYTDAPGARHFERVFADLLGDEGWPSVKLVGERFAVVGLDSTRVWGWGHYLFGRIGAAQLGALRRLLDSPRLAGRTVLVMVHHGPHGPSGGFDWRESGLLDAGALLEVLRDRPVVVLHGHSHHRYWHRAGSGAPHRLGAGSSTEQQGYWELELDDHLRLEAAARPLR